jgi:hypothetical protein
MPGFFEKVKQKISGVGRKAKGAGSRVVSGIASGARSAGRAVTESWKMGTEELGSRVKRIFRQPAGAGVRPASPVSTTGLAERVSKTFGAGIAKIKGIVSGKPKVIMPTITEPKITTEPQKKISKEELEQRRRQIQLEQMERQARVQTLVDVGGLAAKGLGKFGRGTVAVSEGLTGAGKIEGIPRMTTTTERRKTDPYIRVYEGDEMTGDMAELYAGPASGYDKKPGKQVSVYDTVGNEIYKGPSQRFVVPDEIGFEMVTKHGVEMPTEARGGSGVGIRFPDEMMGGPSTSGGKAFAGGKIAGLEEGSGISVKGMKDTISEMTGIAPTGKIGGFKAIEEISRGTAGSGFKGTKIMMDELVGGTGGARVRSPFARGDKGKVVSPFVETKIKIGTPFETMKVGQVTSPWMKDTKATSGINVVAIEKMFGSQKIKAPSGVSPAITGMGGMGAITPVTVPEKMAGVNLNKIMEGMGVSRKVGTVGDITKAPVRVAGMEGKFKLDTSMWGGKIDTAKIGSLMGGRVKAMPETTMGMASVPTVGKPEVDSFDKVASMITVPKRVGMTGTLNIRGMERMISTPKKMEASFDITKIERMAGGPTPKVNLGNFDVKGAEKMMTIKPMTTVKMPKIDVFSTNGEMKRIRKSAARMLLVKDRSEE